MSPETVIAVRALGWTLLHSLWQGAIVVVCIKVLISLIPQRAAKARYHVAVAGFLFLFGWFVSTGIRQWQLSAMPPVTVTENTSGGPAVKTYQLSNEGQPYSDHFLKSLAPQSDIAFNLIAALYITGLLLMMGRMGKSLVYTRRLRSSGITTGDNSWQDHADRLREHLLIDIPVSVQFSSMVHVPVIMGMLKPVILLPLTITSQLSQDQLEAILLHELAHIKRQDYLINIIQSIIETLLFFNPFMWIISAEIRREREHCCDDLVVSCTENPLQYAHALAALAAGRSETFNLGLAATGKKHNLFNRIKRIMEVKTENYHYGKLAAALLIVCGLGISALWLNPSFAQGKKSEEDKTKVWVSDEKLTVTDDNGKQHTYPTLEEWPDKERRRMVKEYAKNGMVMYFGPQNKQIIVDPQTGKTTVNVAGPYVFAHPHPVPMPVPAPFPQAAPQPPAIDAPEEAEAPEPAEAAEDAEPADGMDLHLETGIDNVVSNALASVNWDSVSNTVNVAVKKAQNNVDWKKINIEIQKGIDEANRQINDPKVRADIRNAMKEARKAMDEARVQSRKQVCIVQEDARRQANEAREDARRQADEAREQTRKAMDEARAAMGKAEEAREAAGKADEARAQRRQEVRIMRRDRDRSADLHNMLEQMEGQGLIDRSRKYKVEKTDGRLYINGEEQPADVYNRYSRYLNHDEVRIKGSKSQLSISITDNDNN